MKRCGQAASALLVSVLVLSGGGCSSGSGAHQAEPFDASVDRSVARPSAPVDWPFAPVSMRLHPLTRRIDMAGGSSLPSASGDRTQPIDLEVRVELVDADGYETRSTGRLWLDMTVGGQQWTVGPIELDDARVNRDTWEAITRTYRVGVSLPPAATPETGAVVSIRASLHLPDGRVLDASRELPWR